MNYPFKTIRQSMLNLFCNCQQAFYYRYCEGQIIPPAIAARVGTGVHKAAEINHKQKIDSGMDIPIATMKEIASDTFQKVVNDEGVYFFGSTQELNRELGKGEDLSVKLAEAYGKKIAPQIMPTAAEIMLEAQHSDLPIPFSGTLDVVAQNTILDLKTAKTKWRAGKERESTQPRLYRYLLQENTNEACDFGYHVMAYNGDTQYIEAPNNQSMDRIVAIAKAMLNACDTGTFLPAAGGHWMCSENWCGWYNSGCPYAQ